MQAQVAANVFSCSAAINACNKGRQWQRALDLFWAMPEVDVVSYNASITACEKGSQWQKHGCCWETFSIFAVV